MAHSHEPTLDQDLADRNAHQMLLAGLVLVQPRHHRLYQTSASFHAAIDTLAAMLPAWVEGLAADAERTDTDIALRLQEVRGRLR